MKETKSLLACLLISASLASTVTSTVNSLAIATPAIERSYAQSPDKKTQTQEAAKITLTLEDLPSGFTRSTSIEEQIQRRIAQNPKIKPETIFVFQNTQEKFQFIAGLSFQSPEEIDRTNFDTYFNSKEFLQKFTDILNKQSEAKFGEITAMPLLDNIGQFSVGWTTQGRFSGIPVRIDSGIFGRGKLVFVLLNFYVDGDNSIVPISELARKLDSRTIEQRPPISKPLQ